MKAALRASMVAYEIDGTAREVAVLNSEDVERIERITRTQMEDGAAQVTIRVRGTDYDPGAWIAYVTGIIDNIGPIR